MVQQLRVLTVLREDPGSVLAPFWWLTVIRNFGCRDLKPSFYLSTQQDVVYIHTCKQAHTHTHTCTHSHMHAQAHTLKMTMEKLEEGQRNSTVLVD